MKTLTVIQGRIVTATDIASVQELREQNPSWSQYRLSRELAERWVWRNGDSQL